MRRSTHIRRRQTDRSAETQQLLIDAAIEVLCESGFHGATTTAIAARACVTTGALHHHFATKDELLFGVLDYLSERIVLQFRAFGRERYGDAMDLEVLLERLWTIYGSSQYWAIWEIIIGSRDDERLHERLVQHRERTMEALYQSWLRLNPKIPKLDDQMVEALELLLSCMRGLCLERFLKADEKYFSRQLKHLATIIAPLLLRR
ncbi:TetR/AcrR family transcriptional regulator [Mesorhizobium sp.]|uniref:TetR/AcrR family transcriptional regulator n=1 Tax=Mesorhizobium sp. TaxID=1871066 RepID=UPI0025D3A5C7|nr:TetR/AcrR family transcriptional regulator [Mesorhizobium sp.]